MPFDSSQQFPAPPVDIGAERLRILADWLEANDPHPFNMMDFSCCALHYATTIPAFREAGLHSNGGWPSLPRMRGRPGFHGPFAVAAEFFGIDQHTAGSLFANWSTVTPIEAASHIRGHLAERAARAELVS